MPGGRIKHNVIFKMALKKMAFEKTNLLIELKYSTLKKSLVGIHDNPKRNPREHISGLALLFKIIGGSAKPKGKIEELMSFRKIELKV